ncbi:helix-turn-helix transcriptional regulator [Paraflavitalea speifideaquila]|uniref:helix-turn-helix transcriptional regulator n=1 Tax=Paraflavitalea speifideaquila TaxID=3076558 RepID=UPI0028EB3F6D|nr:helix-turn-helix transcriptional regulator [Paraflavitalea speifideiaquila]
MDISPVPMVITSRQQQVITDIRRCSYHGHMKELFLESKVIELFLLQALFGTSVFGYLNELKMEYGRQMLLESACTVYEVAYMLGYHDPYNFSKAFRKYFGYLPGRLKQ